MNESSQPSPDGDKWARRRAERRAQPAGPYPRICLKPWNDWNWGVYTYPGIYREISSITPVRMLRPDHGVRTAAVRCQRSGEEVQLRILGSRDTVRARLCWLLSAVVAAVAALVLFYYLFTARDGELNPVFFFCTAGASGLSTGGFVGFYNEDGVRLSRRSGHSSVR